MITLVYYLNLSYIATTFLTSGIAKMLWFAQFRELLRSHRVIPTKFIVLVSVIVVVFEIVVGGISLAAILRNKVATYALLLFSMCIAAGCIFFWYIRQLLRYRVGIASCGCSPLPSPLTPASLVPSTTLILLSVAGLAVTSLEFGQMLSIGREQAGIAVTLSILWGITLAGIIILLPASMPRLMANGR